MGKKANDIILSLKAQQLQAIEMKYQRKKYSEIAMKLGLDVGTLNNWFKKDGELYDAYQVYQLEQNKLILSEAQQTIRQNVKKAVDTVLEIMSEGDSDGVRLNAALEFLNRELGKPIQPILQGNLAQQTIEQWKKDLGIDEQSLLDIPKVDVDGLRETSLPVPDGDSSTDS